MQEIRKAKKRRISSSTFLPSWIPHSTAFSSPEGVRPPRGRVEVHPLQELQGDHAHDAAAVECKQTLLGGIEHAAYLHNVRQLSSDECQRDYAGSQAGEIGEPDAGEREARAVAFSLSGSGEDLFDEYAMAACEIREGLGVVARSARSAFPDRDRT